MINQKKNPLNPLTPGTFAKIALFNILSILRLELGQYSFSLVENAFATRQPAVLSTGIAFKKTFWPRHAQKSKF